MYSDWGDPRQYTTGDMGVGECAGEIVPFVQFGLAAAERVAFDAQLKLDRAPTQEAADLAYSAMLEAAKALTREPLPEPRRRPGRGRARVQEAPGRDAALPRSVRGRQVRALPVPRARQRGEELQPEQARQRVQEAQLFIEAAHACVERIDKMNAAAQAPAAPARRRLRRRSDRGHRLIDDCDGCEAYRCEGVRDGGQPVEPRA